MSRLREIMGEYGGIVLVIALMAAVTVLPPDASLKQIRESGVLRACVPQSYPPLVTGDPASPGIDIEILTALAQAMGVRLLVTESQAMGRDFNPRNWAITRAQCHVLAGGVVGSPLTRSFLETSPSYLQTGWAMLSSRPVDTLAGRRVGVHAGTSGLDRLALSAYLRARQAQIVVVTTPEALLEGLAAGRFEVAIAESLLARGMASRAGLSVGWIDDGLARYPLVLGLWKGDLTFKREITARLDQLARGGALEKILARYLGPSLGA